jgi:hypothetical protein
MPRFPTDHERLVSAWLAIHPNFTNLRSRRLVAARPGRRVSVTGAIRQPVGGDANESNDERWRSDRFSTEQGSPNARRKVRRARPTEQGFDAAYHPAESIVRIVDRCAGLRLRQRWSDGTATRRDWRRGGYSGFGRVGERGRGRRFRNGRLRWRLSRDFRAAARRPQTRLERAERLTFDRSRNI